MLNAAYESEDLTGFNRGSDRSESAGHGAPRQTAPLQVANSHCFHKLSSRALPLHVCAGGSHGRGPVLATRASRTPESPSGGQSRPLLTAARHYSGRTASRQSSHCVVNFYHLTNVEHPYEASSLPICPETLAAADVVAARQDCALPERW